ncbi:hypothetical protein GCM10023257_36700 [Streptomyces hyderabadensis]|uniref:Uncharacterized protein n=1 Tax=Streptomyces hyderabadensis TaxID=598549 RepID=A0ABP9I9J0_9ACTN
MVFPLSSSGTLPVMRSERAPVVALSARSDISSAVSPANGSPDAGADADAEVAAGDAVEPGAEADGDVVADPPDDAADRAVPSDALSPSWPDWQPVRQAVAPAARRRAVSAVRRARGRMVDPPGDSR